MGMEYLVFDFGGTFIKYAIMNEATEILEKSKVPSPETWTSSPKDLYERIDPIVNRYRDRVTGIALCMPGMLDHTNGYLRTAGAMKYMAGHTMGSELRERYGIPVSVENDGKAAVLAEHWKGSLTGCHDCAVVIIGTGIGGGIILNDKLLVGKDFSAGEYSYLCVNEKNTDTFAGYWCDYGHRGLSKRLAERTGENPDEIDGIEVFRRVRAGDTATKEALDEFTYAYAVQIYNLGILLDLERVAIGGGISEDPLLMESLLNSADRFRAQLPFYEKEIENLPKPEIVRCRFGSDANLIGALYHHLYGPWDR
ncbi:MAG: ROK family protein [Solobacterium sp.]|nr:ROK family protein [Solobacterium sp.]